MADPVTDTMSDRLEEYMRDLCLAHSGFAAVKVMYRGEPSFVPTALHPFTTIFLRQEGEARGVDGHTDDTGPTRRHRYDGNITVQALVPDTGGLRPDTDRKAEIPSYLEAKQIIQAAKQAILAWADPNGDLTGTPVTSSDGKEMTVELRVDSIQNALMSRGSDNILNIGTFEFHVYTRRMLY